MGSLRMLRRGGEQRPPRRRLAARDVAPQGGGCVLVSANLRIALDTRKGVSLYIMCYACTRERALIVASPTSSDDVYVTVCKAAQRMPDQVVAD